MERWLSGRKHWFAKPTDVYTSRGFKSRSFLFIYPRRGASSNIIFFKEIKKDFLMGINIEGPPIIKFIIKLIMDGGPVNYINIHFIQLIMFIILVLNKKK